MRSVCVYCGSSSGADPVYADAARAFGRALAESGITLVYGGGKVGLMGTVADAAMQHGGKAIGVIPELLLAKEVGHTGLTELHVVKDMHERKKMMADLSDGFVALPGGVGTYEELFEVYTWAQLGYHQKPVGVLNIAGYFDPLKTMLEHTVTAGFMRREYVDLLQFADTPPALLDRLQHYTPVALDKWSRHRDAV
ncbi:TIGR00730 family Rossman fold protein [Pararobbsia silviterrae]|uniref:Cytokinin riboside 5'-monophosphate phosphoribohydrolase n=1 Tax=Pararobbsia silviterrae TaxID=1792498 RepID=A0A494Y5E5_9BURK|nr:TIGR00730 family Rossman fold protein [Pararobbsia silviterrae]RKP57861.1 TIGR00730 family Rossman fold protein [Pararobbsia silviterrae]